MSHALILVDPVDLLRPATPFPLGLVACKVGPELVGPTVSFLAILAYIRLLAFVHDLEVAEEVIDPVHLQPTSLLRTLVLLSRHIVQLDMPYDKSALYVLLAFRTPRVVAARLNPQTSDLKRRF